MQHHICTLLHLHLWVSDQGGAHVVTDDELESFPSLHSPQQPSPPAAPILYGCADGLWWSRGPVDCNLHLFVYQSLGM